MFMAKVPPIHDPTLLHTLRIPPNAQHPTPTPTPLHHLPTTMQLYFSLFLSAPFSLTHNHTYCPRSAYHHSAKHCQEAAKTAILYNASSATSQIQHTLSQYYCLTMLSILQRGQSGHYMAQYIVQQ